ncbi:MAG: glycosyltransferase family 4 protein [Methanospirillaceae archaeon]|nr:glycosyltransferase family 4 protein [Methanospirillaceae archaeon]
MRINFIVEDMLFFKYIGCATAARSLYRHLFSYPDIDPGWKFRDFASDISHYHTFGPFALAHERFDPGIHILTAHSTPRINNGNIACSTSINHLYPRIYSRFDHVVAISETSMREVAEMVPDMPVTYIPNGVDRDYFAPNPEKGALFRETYGIGEDEKMVLTVAQQSPRKGIYDLFALAEENPHTRFVWVGGFPYGPLSKHYDRIRKLKEKKHDNILFTGFVSDIRAPYCAADLFFMPSYAETFGLVILEALSSGVPVLARNIPEFQEIFGSRISFFDTVEDATDLIHDETHLRIAANDARESTSPFDMGLIAQRHVDLYSVLVNS